MLQRARSWLLAPEQEMLRWELVWFTRWIRQPLVLFWLCVWFAATLSSNWLMLYLRKFVAEHASMGVAVSSTLPVLMLLLVIPGLGIPFVGWYHLFSRRIATRTEREHIVNLLLIPSESSRLWPAMVASPALWFSLFSVISAVPVMLLWPFYSKYFTFSQGLCIHALDIPVSFVAGLAMTSAAAEKSIGTPKGKALFWPILVIIAYLFLIVATTVTISSLHHGKAGDLYTRLILFVVLLLVARHYMGKLRNSHSWQDLVQKRTLLNT